jgi:hypothetical protein
MSTMPPLVSVTSLHLAVALAMLSTTLGRPCKLKLVINDQRPYSVAQLLMQAGGRSRSKLR